MWRTLTFRFVKRATDNIARAISLLSGFAARQRYRMFSSLGGKSRGTSGERKAPMYTIKSPTTAVETGRHRRCDLCYQSSVCWQPACQPCGGNFAACGCPAQTQRMEPGVARPRLVFMMCRADLGCRHVVLDSHNQRKNSSLGRQRASFQRARPVAIQDERPGLDTSVRSPTCC